MELCNTLTSSDYKLLSQNHPLGKRLVCREYSKSVQDVKSYPLLSQEQLFLLCWNFYASECLSASMYPAPETFTYHFSFHDGDKTQLHTHDYIELSYVVKGSFKQRICEKDITFHEGELCLIDKNCIHQDYLLDQSSVVLFFGIENEMFKEIIHENILTQKITAFLHAAMLKQKDLQQYLHFKPLPGAKETLESCLSLLVKELFHSTIGSSYICQGLIMRIFHLLSSSYEFSLSKEQKKTMNWILFEEITDYINANYRTITIQELQTQFHFQEDYFNRMIKKYTGMNYSSYVQEIRLQHAEQMILHTSKTIAEITELVGYHNKGFFYRIFQKKYGCTPKEYRKTVSNI